MGDQYIKTVKFAGSGFRIPNSGDYTMVSNGNYRYQHCKHLLPIEMDVYALEWEPNLGECYLFSNDKINWIEAESYGVSIKDSSKWSAMIRKKRSCGTYHDLELCESYTYCKFKVEK